MAHHDAGATPERAAAAARVLDTARGEAEAATARADATALELKSFKDMSTRIAEQREDALARALEQVRHHCITVYTSHRFYRLQLLSAVSC